MAERIRAHDWAATPLGPIAGWSDRLRLMVEQVLATPLVSSLVCGPERVLIYNDTAARLYGDRHPGALGRPVPEVFPDEWAVVAALYDRVFSGENVQVTAQPVDVGGRGDPAATVFDAYLTPVREPDGRVVSAHMIGFEVSDRLRAEAALRESEERQRFLLKLSDALRPLMDAAAIQGEACRLLGERLGVDRAYYVEINETTGVATVERDYVAESAISLVGAHPLASFSWSVDILRRGGCLVVGDTQDSPVVPPAERAAFTALQIMACMGAPLIKTGALVGALCVTAARPRVWTEAEPGLIREVGERIWSSIERARAEVALRESEERFAQFATASSDGLWIRDAATLRMEYVSPAISAIYGIAPEDLLGDVGRWTDLIVPEDRDIAVEHLARARSGEAVVHEFRILRPLDGALRWIRDTDFPLQDADGHVQRIGGIAEDVTEAKRAAQRQQVLVNELQHRARNLLGVVTAIASRTVKQGGSVEAFEKRLQALSRVQGLLSQGGSDRVEVGALVGAELAAYVGEGSEYVSVAGPAVYLTAQQVQTFALALHELTTNAVKHGALRDGIGHLSVTWDLVRDQRERRRLALSWVESGVILRPETGARRGYGTELIQEALAYALQAKVEYALGADGVRCRIEMPIC
ncbi:hypothetical protein ADL19_05595 [Streptomyces purpurogeneiscleroticus]|nr:hypothetical protein ADL19_05595 [Streptomyces purpurogeneiscleroticus]